MRFPGYGHLDRVDQSAWQWIHMDHQEAGPARSKNWMVEAGALNALLHGAVSTSGRCSTHLSSTSPKVIRLARTARARQRRIIAPGRQAVRRSSDTGAPDERPHEIALDPCRIGKSVKPLLALNAAVRSRLRSAVPLPNSNIRRLPDPLDCSIADTRSSMRSHCCLQRVYSRLWRVTAAEVAAGQTPSPASSVTHDWPRSADVRWHPGRVRVSQNLGL